MRPGRGLGAPRSSETRLVALIGPVAAEGLDGAVNGHRHGVGPSRRGLGASRSSEVRLVALVGDVATEGLHGAAHEHRGGVGPARRRLGAPRVGGGIFVVEREFFSVPLQFFLRKTRCNAAEQNSFSHRTRVVKICRGFPFSACCVNKRFPVVDGSYFRPFIVLVFLFR